MHSSAACAGQVNKKHLKNVGPIRHCEPPHTHSPGVAVARRLRIDVHDDNANDNDNDNNDNAWQRGPLWPHGMGPIIQAVYRNGPEHMPQGKGHFRLKGTPSRRRSGPPSSTRLSELVRVHIPKCISIGSAVFAQLIHVPNTRTDIGLARPRYAAVVTSIHCLHVIWPNEMN